VRAPAIAPYSVVDSVPMPSVKIPNNGPLTTPKIVITIYDKNMYFIVIGILFKNSTF